MGGGGLLVLKLDTTPMTIVGEYGDQVVNGAGCGGVEAKGTIYINAGVSAGGGGNVHSTFSLYAFQDELFSVDSTPSQNIPQPETVFKDEGNTQTLGNNFGDPQNISGQKPVESTRRDAHGAGVTINGRYVHVADRIQNVIEVFDTKSNEHVNTYDLVSVDGQSGIGNPGPCLARSVTDDMGLDVNDPAPDLFQITPDGRYFAVAFRGPAPVTVRHSAQGSCPGVGIVEITEGGRSGRLVDVLRSSNTIDTVTVNDMPGGHAYTGAERSDIHGAIVIPK